MSESDDGGQDLGPWGQNHHLVVRERERERQAESQLTDLEIEWNSERMHRKFREWRQDCKHYILTAILIREFSIMIKEFLKGEIKYSIKFSHKFYNIFLIHQYISREIVLSG